ncbi:hypothetical protein BJV74DRAFT_255645 [Russula compacta]|nr:hypothetical protein BJV74DRAFT_255645 [Russula compacta]
MLRSEGRRGDTLAPLYANDPAQYPQRRRRRSPFHPDHDAAATVAPTSTPHHRQTASPHSQTALFRAASPPLLFAILIAGLLIELRVRLASPLPEATTTTTQLPIPPGVSVSVSVSTHGGTAMQRALIWAESRWPGPWALPALCVAALGTLRAAIWAGAAVLERFEERVNGSDAAAARVRIGRWEDGGSVSGSELLAGMFT